MPVVNSAAWKSIVRTLKRDAARLKHRLVKISSDVEAENCHYTNEIGTYRCERCGLEVQVSVRYRSVENARLQTPDEFWQHCKG